MNSIRKGGRCLRSPDELYFILGVEYYMLHAVIARTASLCARDSLVTGTKETIKRD
jgi:hypothetical protein